MVFNEDEMAMTQIETLDLNKASDINIQRSSLVQFEDSTISCHLEDMEDENQVVSSGDIAQSELESYQLARDRARREVIPPDRFGYVDYTTFALNTVEEIVGTKLAPYQEAMNSRNEEMTSLIKNKTWITIEKPSGKNVICCKWIFGHKEGLPGEPIKYKVRLVAKGVYQRQGIDFSDIFTSFETNIHLSNNSQSSQI